MNKKITLLTALFFTAGSVLLAQNKARFATEVNSSAEAAPSVQTVKLNPGNNQVNALFDVQFNYNATDSSAGRTGMAGVVFTGTEFWVSRWQSDTIHTFSPTGSYTGYFRITGVSGVRAFTTDGISVYAGVNTTSIKVIDPVSKTLTTQFTNAAGINVRHITYDSTANGGAGGFWIGNFNTNLVQISMTGTTLQTIPAATHGLTGMYGSAIDHWTAGGPYLWVYDQGGAATSRIVRLSLPSGTPTGLTHETLTDIGVNLTSGLAGGLFITNKITGGVRTIVGLIQGTPDNLLFGYELNDLVLPAVDAKLDTIRPSSPYMMRPLNHYTTNLTWTGSLSNSGASTLTSTDLVVNVKNSGGATIFTGTGNTANLSMGASVNVNTSTGLAASTTGTYSVVAYSRVNAPQTDLVASNDTLRYSYMVTDTVFARETGVTSGSLGIGGGTAGTLGQVFVTSVADQARSATFALNGPTLGDSTRAHLYSFAGTPGTILASTKWHKFTAADTNGVVLTLPFIGAPYALPAGSYFLGVEEVMDNVTLATTTFNFNPNAAWVIFGANPWAPIESYGFSRTFYLRLNVGGTTGISSLENGNASLLVYPNPANTQLNIATDKNLSANAEVQIFNVIGKMVFNGKANNNGLTNIDLTSFSNGVYFVKLIDGNKISTSRFVVEK
jgi:hypothetical protein